MPNVNIVREIEVKQTPRVLQLQGIFDLSKSKQQQRWNVNLPIDDFNWNIGVIVGRSGAGKTTIARELFNGDLISEYDWSSDRSIVDDFSKNLSIKEITQLLSSVGFSSPPNWLVPFRCLSNGEQFRVTIARAIAENREITVVDEFTSVVDRTVAQIGSAAIAKTIRKRQQKFIAVSCHYDIIDWLEPDWVFDVTSNTFQKKSGSVPISSLISLKLIKARGSCLGNITI